MPLQHHFAPGTRVYTHSSEQMQNPKVEGEFLAVLNATPDPLPALAENEAARRLEDDSAWEVVADFRGTAWHTDTKESIEITDVGPLPEGYTHLEPSQHDRWNSNAWDKDDAAELDYLRQVAARNVRVGFTAAAVQPTPANGTTWNGGMDSALALDGAVRLAEQNSATEIDLYDADNEEHTVDIATGRTIAAAVADDFQIKLKRKQQLLRDIKTANADQLDSLVWTD